ncbi:hypothetical protein ZIOFF_004809 [Zingiber officinale]|uniref:Uncharacterized protein n=1 Tax=Zingiber officinale TaxID=94328 RepID=A0A8J5HUN7_ZINOF|nr:hypothetical protein ZIOFF_004809 [Zingiber officinale]
MPFVTVKIEEGMKSTPTKGLKSTPLLRVFFLVENPRLVWSVWSRLCRWSCGISERSKSGRIYKVWLLEEFKLNVVLSSLLVFTWFGCSRSSLSTSTWANLTGYLVDSASRIISDLMHDFVLLQ